MSLIVTIVFLFELAIIGRVILSWFPLSNGGARSVMDLLVRIT